MDEQVLKLAIVCVHARVEHKSQLAWRFGGRGRVLSRFIFNNKVTIGHKLSAI